MDDPFPSPLVRAAARRPLPKRAPVGSFLLVCLILVGCQSPRPREPQAMPPVADPVTAPDYRMVFPDILDVSVPQRPDSTGRFLVMPDGNVELGRLGNVFVEGKTVAEVTKKIADAAGLPEGQVVCRVSQHRSRVVHVIGPGGAMPGTLPYAGTERVTEVLNRAGISGQQNLSEVQVVRRNTSTGRPEETFRVDLTAIRAGDPQTNLILEPNDEIHLTESHPSFIYRNLPTLFRPVSEIRNPEFGIRN